MKKETWRRIDDCLADALEMPSGDREEFLRSRLSDDELQEALKLVSQAERAERLFAKGPVEGLAGLEAGARLGPWELVKPLGSGGMGVVWLAKRVDGQASMLAAIKMLPPALSGPLREDQDLRQRFLIEKQILARLRHPNIAQLLDAGAGIGDTPNFIMEYVEGVPLMEFVKQERVDRLGLFLRICDAVQYAHANLVIHRDLKPQNILVNGAGEPKLLDFGIGKILNDPAGDASVTLRRAFSLDYASPEQIRGGAISMATDVYSLGLILFEMVTGERARRWNDKALGEVLEESGRFALPWKQGISGDLRAVLEKATAVEERMRYRTVSDFAADVLRVMEGKPIEARAAGVLYLLGCFVRRNRVAVGAGMLALSLIIGLGVWGWVSARESKMRSIGLQSALQAEKAARVEVEAAKKEAERQGFVARQLGELAGKREKQAEEGLKDLLKVFDAVVTSARWEVAKLPGGTTASISLLKKALSQIESIPTTERTRANYLLLRAEAHGQLAELFGGDNSNIGEEEKGRLHRQRSVALWTELNRMRPERTDWARGLLESKFRAAVPELPSRFTEPSPEWQAFERKFLDLRRRAPQDPMLARNLGTFYFYYSQRTQPGQPQRIARMEEALRYFKEGGGERSTRTLRDQALAHKYLAGLVKAVDKLGHASEAMRLDQLRVEQDPQDAAAKLDLGFSIVSVADANFAMKREAEAQSGYWSGYQLRKGLAMQDAKNVFLWRSLNYPIRSYGQTSGRMKDLKGIEIAVKEMEWLMASPGATIRDEGRKQLSNWKEFLAKGR
ncbi:MAG: serine/threonine protein kinase [Acidobacteria bacterium]|nr:serine/threonine protein kinase [Acidobacteriota bacterium]